MARHALCIGIDDYPGRAGSLRGCVNDANDWAEAFLRRRFVVDTLVDRAATRSAIVAHIGTLLDRSAPGDLLVVTYSGHGTWLPEDGDRVDRLGARSHSLGRDDSPRLLDQALRERFAVRSPGMRIVLIADCCHAGAAARGAVSAFDDPARHASPTSAAKSTPTDTRPGTIAGSTNLFAGFMQAGVDLLLAGCRDTQRSWDAAFDGRPNGAFTYHALRAMRALRHDATYDDWFNRIRASLPSTRAPQEPQIFGAPEARRARLFA